MDKLRDLIFDLTKNKIAKKKQLLGTTDNPANYDRLRDLQQIDDLNVDDNILAEMQKNPKLLEIKKDRDIESKDFDLGIPKVQRYQAGQRLDKFIKDNANLIGTSDDYRKDQVEGYRDEYGERLYPLDSFDESSEGLRLGEILRNNPEIGVWTDRDLDKKKDIENYNKSKFEKLTKKLK